MGERGDAGDRSEAEAKRAEALVSDLRAAMPALLRDKPVALAYLHGSAARGQSTPLSDVDIALVVDEAMAPGSQLRLMLSVQRELDDVCGIVNADVRVINEASLVFQGKVVTDGILIYARTDEGRVAYEETTRLRYFDFLPIHRQLQDAFLASIEEQGLYGRPRQS